MTMEIKERYSTWTEKTLLNGFGPWEFCESVDLRFRFLKESEMSKITLGPGCEYKGEPTWNQNEPGDYYMLGYLECAYIYARKMATFFSGPGYEYRGEPTWNFSDPTEICTLGHTTALSVNPSMRSRLANG